MAAGDGVVDGAGVGGAPYTVSSEFITPDWSVAVALGDAVGLAVEVAAGVGGSRAGAGAATATASARELKSWLAVSDSVPAYPAAKNIASLKGAVEFAAVPPGPPGVPSAARSYTSARSENSASTRVSAAAPASAAASEPAVTADETSVSTSTLINTFLLRKAVSSVKRPPDGATAVAAAQVRKALNVAFSLCTATVELPEATRPLVLHAPLLVSPGPPVPSSVVVRVAIAASVRAAAVDCAARGVDSVNADDGAHMLP